MTIQAASLQMPTKRLNGLFYHELRRVAFEALWFLRKLEKSTLALMKLFGL